MKNLFILLLFVFSGSIGFAQNCEPPKLEDYKIVLNDAFDQDYKKCLVTIKGVFHRVGYLTGWKKPNKLKKDFFFQCLSLEKDTETNVHFSEEKAGQFFTINRSKGKEILNYKQGDTLVLTGKTFIQNFYGKEINTFFRVEKIENLGQ